MHALSPHQRRAEVPARVPQCVGERPFQSELLGLVPESLAEAGVSLAELRYQLVHVEDVAKRVLQLPIVKPVRRSVQHHVFGREYLPP